MSIWERYKTQLFHYGHIYATLLGLVVINYDTTASVAYTPRSLKYWTQRLAHVYSHIFHLMLIVVLPVYFVWNMGALLHVEDARYELLLLVSLVNTGIKYVTVIVTYIANLVHYNAIRNITRTRQQLEDELQALPVRAGICDYELLRRQFESFLLSKFMLINAMILVQGGTIWYMHHLRVSAVRLQYSWYAFVLWNYTENMANYFYFIKCSIFKFYRQVNVQLLNLLHETQRLRSLQRRCRAKRRLRGVRQCNGLLMERCNGVCDRLDALAAHFDRIYTLYADSVHMHEFQILGILLTSLLSNLTNCFTLFNIFYKQETQLNSITYWMIMLNLAHTCIFYMDTTIVSLSSDLVGVSQRDITNTLARFASIPTLDVRLNQTLDNFVLKMLQLKPEFHICGLFNIDKRRIFVIASTTLTYFITLVQFDLNSSGRK